MQCYRPHMNGAQRDREPRLPFRRLAAAALSAAALSGCLTTQSLQIKPLPPDIIPPVVAVSSFENRSGFKGQWQLGSGMADLLVAELVRSQNFVVVERQHLNRVMNELRRQRDKHFRNEGKVDLGRLKNARYLIRGVINDFSQAGGASLSVAFRKILFLGKGHQARVAMTLTIVDVESGEIVDSAQCAGTAHAREVYLKAKYKGVSFGGSKFFRTPLGIATSKAIRQGIYEIVQKVPRQQWQPLIAEITQDNVLILNGGADRGVRLGAQFQIRAQGTPVTDPVTGDLLDMVPGALLGTVEVFQVSQSLAHAKILTGAGFKRGQRLFPLAPGPAQP